MKRLRFAQTVAIRKYELKINFFRSVWYAKLIAEAGMVRHGTTVGMVECDTVDEDERFVARVFVHLSDLRENGLIAPAVDGD